MLPESPPSAPLTVVVLGMLLMLASIAAAVATEDTTWILLGVLALLAAVAFGLAESDGDRQ